MRNFIIYLKIITLVILVFFSFKGFICFALNNLGLNILLPVISGISAFISNMLKKLYLYPRHDLKDINLTELLYKSLLASIIAFFIVSLIQLLKLYIELNYDEIICIPELFITIFTVLLNEKMTLGGDYLISEKIINLNMNNPSSSGSASPSSSSSSSSSASSGSASSSSASASASSSSASNNAPSSRSSRRRLNPDNPFASVDPNSERKIVYQELNYQNQQATSTSAPGKTWARMVCKLDSDKSNKDSWVKQTIGSSNNDISELKVTKKLLEDGLKKIKTGIKDDGFDRVEYNATYNRLFVRGKEGTSNSGRGFLNLCLNEDLRRIRNINYDISRVKANLDSHLSEIPQENSWIQGTYKAQYNTVLDNIQELERQYYSSFNTVTGIETETNDSSDSDSVSGSESGSE